MRRAQLPLAAERCHTLSTPHLFGNQLAPLRPCISASFSSRHRATLLCDNHLPQDAVHVALTYVLIVPPVNRQIMDLWFSLVYIMDDFKNRVLLYEQVAYRQLREQIDKIRKRYGSDPDWSDWLEDMEDLSKLMESEIPLTSEQKANPSKEISSWPSPHDLSTKPSKCQDFLKLLDEEIYGEVSIVAHLKPAGLMQAAGIALAYIAPEAHKKMVEERTIHQFKFRNFFQTVITLLGIISEIEMYCKLGNAEQIAKVWQRMAARNHDARDIYEARYKAIFP
jgi:hypothetical protein